MPNRTHQADDLWVDTPEYVIFSVKVYKNGKNFGDLRKLIIDQDRRQGGEFELAVSGPRSNNAVR